MSAWQPIETAPKDGTLVALAEGAFLATGLWRDVYRAWMTPTDQGWQRHVIDPTHWAPPAAILPLPEARGTERESVAQNNA